MLYRKFPKIPSLDIPVLGFGMMRLPCINNKSDQIDIGKTQKLIEEAYRQGITYFDTGYTYHGGNSEKALGTCINSLKIRDNVFLADKCPVWLVEKSTDWEKFLDEQLERLGTDYIDFYLIHALNKDRWNKVLKLGGLQFIEKAKSQGKIRHIGFSFHDDHETFKTVVDGFSGWEFCQIQFNYLDTEKNGCFVEEGLKNLAYAAQHSLGAVAMEPMRGGLLASPPKEIRDIFASADVPRMSSEWALRWVWEHQDIVCALSGMNDMHQVLSNCAAASAAKPNSLPSSQLACIDKARAAFVQRMKVPCTSCHYCVPCPSAVAIPAVFSEYNRISLSGALDGQDKAVSVSYTSLSRQGHGGESCTGCGECLAKCPQHIDIPAVLAQAHRIMHP